MVGQLQYPEGPTLAGRSDLASISVVLIHAGHLRVMDGLPTSGVTNAPEHE